MDDLADSPLDPRITAFALSGAVCNQGLAAIRTDLWDSFIQRLGSVDFESARIAEGLVMTVAVCVATDPSPYLRGRLGGAWPVLPAWFRARLRVAIERELTDEKRDRFRATLATLPAGDMKAAFSE